MRMYLSLILIAGCLCDASALYDCRYRGTSYVYDIRDMTACNPHDKEHQTSHGKVYSPDISQMESSAHEVFQVTQSCRVNTHLISSNERYTSRIRNYVGESEARLIMAGVCIGGTKGIPVQSNYRSYRCEESIWKDQIIHETYCIKRQTTVLSTGNRYVQASDIPVINCHPDDGICETPDNSYVLYTPMNTSITKWVERYDGLISLSDNLATIQSYTSSFILTNGVEDSSFQGFSTCRNTTKGWVVYYNDAKSRGIRDHRDDEIRKEERAEDTAKLQYLLEMSSDALYREKRSCQSLNRLLKSSLSTTSLRNNYLAGVMGEEMVSSSLSGNFVDVWPCVKITSWSLDVEQNGTFYPAIHYVDESGVMRRGFVDPLKAMLVHEGGPSILGRKYRTLVDVDGSPHICEDTSCHPYSTKGVKTLEEPPQPTPPPSDAGNWFVSISEYHSMDRETALSGHVYEEIKQITDSAPITGANQAAMVDVPFSTPNPFLSLLFLIRWMLLLMAPISLWLVVQQRQIIRNRGKESYLTEDSLRCLLMREITNKRHTALHCSL